MYWNFKSVKQIQPADLLELKHIMYWNLQQSSKCSDRASWTETYNVLKYYIRDAISYLESAWTETYNVLKFVNVSLL